MKTDGIPLALSQFDEIEGRMCQLRAAYGAFAPSEYAFSNLYLFRRAHAYRYFPGKLPGITGITYDGVRHFLPLFDLREVKPADLHAVLEQADCMYPVPKEVLQDLDPDRFSWSDSLDDADYIYSAANFSGYRGDLLRKKRNLMRQLLAGHVIQCKPLSSELVPDAKAVLASWMKDKGMVHGAADELACLEALDMRARFGLDGHIYYADDVPAGFLLTQRLSPTLAVMRFSKGCDAYKGIYQYMFHHYCSNQSGWLEWLNFEQDLGLENFRKTKRSYQPSTMLRKYRVRCIG